MSALATIARCFTKPLSRNGSCGWIGVDVGTRLIKLAQLERTAQGWQWAGQWIIGSEEDQPLTQEMVRTGELASRMASVKDARKMFRGRLCAATLPSMCTQLRSLELPTGPRQQLLAMVEQELAADSEAVAEFDFDAWEVETAGELSKVLAVSSARADELAVARGLFSAGLECAVLDSTACATARAISLCDPASQEEPVAALDLGDHTAVLTVVYKDAPVFSRTLRNCGLQTLMQRVQEKLNVGRHECRQLLMRHALPKSREPEGGDAIYRITAPPLDDLIEELRRTFQFIQHQTSGWMPKRLWLIGGGATTSNLPEFLGGKLGLPTALWRLSAIDSGAADQSEPLFAVAAGLSQLAWEAHSCT